MPVYNITDPTSGKSVKLTGDSPPTEQELVEIFAKIGGGSAVPSQPVASQQNTPTPQTLFDFNGAPLTETSDNPLAQGIWQGLKMTGLGALQTILQGGQGIRKTLGMESNQPNVDKIQAFIDSEKKKFANTKKESPWVSGGELIGGTLPTLAMPGGAGKGLIEKILSSAIQGGTIGSLQPTSGNESKIGNVGIGALTGGATAGILHGLGGKEIKDAAGQVAKETIGITTGAGKGSIEEAIKGGQAFKDAMRGKISGEDVVDNAKSALNVIKENRAKVYQEHLANLSGANTPNAVSADIDLSPIAKKLQELLKNYNIKGTLDPVTNDIVIDTSGWTSYYISELITITHVYKLIRYYFFIKLIYILLFTILE